MRALRIGVLALVLAMNACSVVSTAVVAAYEAALPPLPVPEVEPLPERVRAVLWAELGGDRATPRQLGVPAFGAALVRESVDIRRTTEPALWVAHHAGRNLTAREGEYRGLEWHARSLRNTVRVARWWTAERTLDVIGGTTYALHGLRGLREAAQHHYRRPLEDLDDSELAVLVAIGTGRNPEWVARRARATLARLGRPAPASDAELLAGVSLNECIPE